MSDWIEIEERILDVLKDSQKPILTTNQVSKTVNIHHSTAKKHLELMEFYGVVERITDGRIILWSLASSSS